MRAFIISLALVSLAACGQPAGNNGGGARQAEPGSVAFGSLQNMPDWLFILRTTDGGTIHFNQRTVTRADGMADIWLQVRHGQQQLFEMESETAETVVRYEVERIHYRFNCAEETFVIVERQVMGANEQVVARDEPRQIWRATPAQGAASHILPIACRGA
ncbi:MAG: surface-adhesin E family protein [Hyphomonadaceae bacterium]